MPLSVQKESQAWLFHVLRMTRWRKMSSPRQVELSSHTPGLTWRKHVLIFTLNRKDLRGNQISTGSFEATFPAAITPPAGCRARGNVSRSGYKYLFSGIIHQRGARRVSIYSVLRANISEMHSKPPPQDTLVNINLAYLLHLLIPVSIKVSRKPFSTCSWVKCYVN